MREPIDHNHRMTIRSAFTVFPDDSEPDDADRIEISPTGSGFMLEAFGRSMQAEAGEDCIGFTLTASNLEEIVTVCNALLGKGPAPNGS